MEDGWWGGAWQEDLQQGEEGVEGVLGNLVLGGDEGGKMLTWGEGRGVLVVWEGGGGKCIRRSIFGILCRRGFRRII